MNERNEVMIKTLEIMKDLIVGGFKLHKEAYSIILALMSENSIDIEKPQRSPTTVPTLITNVMDRGTGKTTKAIEEMQNNEQLHLIIPLSEMKKGYPTEFRNRIHSMAEVLNGSIRDKRINTVILDEGFQLDKEKLAHLYYYLGLYNIKTVSYGTIEK